MAGITKANAVIAAAARLGDATYQLYTGSYAAGTTTYLEELVDRVVHEISIRNPLRKRTNLAIIDYTWDIDLSSLDFLRIRDVIYPASIYGKKRVVELHGSTLTLQIDGYKAPTIGSGTLTGTVSFTQNSRTVTGSGTAFLTELSVGDLICKGSGSAYKWYRISEIASDTSLILYELFEEASGADTINLTKYRDSGSCVHIEYDGVYTVSTTSDMPARFDDVLKLGVEAYALKEFARDKASDTLTAIGTDLTSAREKIPTNNPGGDEAAKYATLIQTQVATAQMISSYKDLGNARWQEYQNWLNRITPNKMIKFGDRSL